MENAIHWPRLGEPTKPENTGQYQPTKARLGQLKPRSDTSSQVKSASDISSQFTDPLATLSQLQPSSATSKNWRADHTDVCEANVVWRDRPLCDAHAA